MYGFEAMHADTCAFHMMKIISLCGHHHLCPQTRWLSNSTTPLSNVLANAFSLHLRKVIVAHLDKSFSVGQMPYIPK